MKPIELKLSGFLSYRQAVELNFESFDLACISGSNGAGKSSLLDAITWVLFGQARRRDDTIINSHCERAEVTLDFHYEGNIYRVQRSKGRNKPVVLDLFIQDSAGKWKTLSERSMRETESRIEQILRMDYDTFTNASFFLQGKADQFAQQRPGDRKRILGSILGLEIWETYRESAQGRRKRQEMDLAAINSRLDEINSELQQESVRRAQLKALQAELEQVSGLRKAREETLEQIRRLAASLAEQQRLVEMLNQQVNALRQRIAARETTLLQRQAERVRIEAQIQSADRIDTAFVRWQKLRQELEAWDARAARYREIDAQRAQPKLIIQSERTRLETELAELVKQQRQAEQLIESLPALQLKLTTVRGEIETSNQKLLERAALENELNELKTVKAEAAAENTRLKAEMKEIQERIERLQQASGAACPLCGQPLSEQDRLRLVKELEENGKQLGDRHRSNRASFQQAEDRSSAIEHNLRELKNLEPVLRGQQRNADQLEDQSRQITTTAADWHEVRYPLLVSMQQELQAGDYAADARLQLAKLDKQLQEIDYDAIQHEALRQTEQKMRTTDEEKRSLDQARAALEPLKREITELEKNQAEDESEITRLSGECQQAEVNFLRDRGSLPDLDQAETELFTLQEQENRILIEVGGARQAVEVLKTQQKRQAELQVKREDIHQQIAQLKTLERAFSKDGIPALLIEQALPEIETQANEILDRLTAGGMSVRFETQQEYKDKKREDRRETLDIMISDAAGMRDYALFSGGEAFRVNFAIRLALSRVLAQRAGARLQSLVIDEGFGSQDSEGRQRLIEAINMVRSDFEIILVITHLEELKDAFPARIEVLKTAEGSSIKVVA